MLVVHYAPPVIEFVRCGVWHYRKLNFKGFCCLRYIA